MRLGSGMGAIFITLAIVACGGGDIGGEGDDDGTGATGTGASGLGGEGAGASSAMGGASATGGTDATGGMAAGGDSSGTGGMTSSSSSSTGGSPPTGCNADGVALINEINAYRMQNGLPAVPASSSLCIVAENHVNDLRDNAPHAPAECNLHSWSNQGSWTACCYTADHAQAQCMWSKPSELTNYNSNGYEISYAGSNNPQNAVSAWSGSEGHNNVILNLQTWASYPWGAVGAAQHDGFAHVWFGTASDPN